MADGMFNEHFGTLRGAVRLAFAYAEIATGLASVVRPTKGSVQRLVFVCHGNICRSAFAEAVARRQGVDTVSFGLSTVSGKPAHEPVVASAREFGLDLSSHRTTSAADYLPREGDYLLAMEVRQLRSLAANERLAHVPRGLLGSYAALPFPHLHDPFGLSDKYLGTCLERIERAVTGACGSFPSACVG